MGIKQVIFCFTEKFFFVFVVRHVDLCAQGSKNVKYTAQENETTPIYFSLD